VYRTASHTSSLAGSSLAASPSLCIAPPHTPPPSPAPLSLCPPHCVSHRLSHRLSTVFLQGVKLRVDDLVEGRMPCATLLEAVRTLRTGEILPLPSLPVT
jgi:hypothetical protein